MHCTTKVHDQLWIGALEFREARHDPKRAERLGRGEPDLARDRGLRDLTRARDFKRSAFHVFDDGKDALAVRRQGHAVDVAREKLKADLPFELVDAPPHGVAGAVERVAGSSKTAAADHFQKYAQAFPIGNRPLFQRAVRHLRAAPVQNRMHTRVPVSSMLAKLWRVYNGEGSSNERA